MPRLRQRFTAIFVGLVFAALELLSAAPALHGHAQGMDAALLPAAAVAGAIPTTASLAPHHGELKGQASGECPVCAIAGLVAVVSCRIGVATPVPHLQRISSFVLQSAPTAILASVRGRAPPRA